MLSQFSRAFICNIAKVIKVGGCSMSDKCFKEDIINVERH